MAKNRKNQSAAIRFGAALKAFLLCLLICGSGLGYVWQKEQIYELGQVIRKREMRLEVLEKQDETFRGLLSDMRLPQALRARIKEMNLGLVAPDPSQVWYLPEPTREMNRQNRPLTAQTPPVAMNE